MSPGAAMPLVAVEKYLHVICLALTNLGGTYNYSASRDLVLSLGSKSGNYTCIRVAMWKRHM